MNEINKIVWIELQLKVIEFWTYKTKTIGFIVCRDSVHSVVILLPFVQQTFTVCPFTHSRGVILLFNTLFYNFYNKFDLFLSPLLSLSCNLIKTNAAFIGITVRSIDLMYSRFGYQFDTGIQESALQRSNHWTTAPILQ